MNKIVKSTCLSFVYFFAGVGMRKVADDIINVSRLSNNDNSIEEEIINEDVDQQFIYKIFPPKTHCICYAIKYDNIDFEESKYIDSKIDIPEGYELASVLESKTGANVYLVNNVSVNASGIYDNTTNEIVFLTPGEVVNNMTLKK